MCNQTVCLIAAELERHGIATTSIVLLRSIAEKVRPPRALCVPFPHGFPLGQPGDDDQQRNVIMSALNLLGVEGPPPLIVDYRSG